MIFVSELSVYSDYACLDALVTLRASVHLEGRGGRKGARWLARIQLIGIDVSIGSEAMRQLDAPRDSMVGWVFPLSVAKAR